MALFLSGDIHECIYIYRDIETYDFMNLSAVLIVIH
jgi:hypothetical protein